MVDFEVDFEGDFKGDLTGSKESPKNGLKQGLKSLKSIHLKLKQSLSTSSLFGICIWGDSIQRPSHPEAQVIRHLASLATATKNKKHSFGGRGVVAAIPCRGLLFHYSTLQYIFQCLNFVLFRTSNEDIRKRLICQ